MEGYSTIRMKKNNRYLEVDNGKRNIKYEYTNRLEPNETNKKHVEYININRCYSQNVKTNQRQFPITDSPKIAHFISQSDPVGFRHNQLVEKKSFTPARRKPIKPVFFQGESGTSHAKEIKKPKITCSVPVINCVVGDKQHISDRKWDGRSMNFEEDLNECFADKTFYVDDPHETGNSSRCFNKYDYLSKQIINKTEHQHVELEPKFRNMLKEDYEKEKIYIKPSSPIGSSSSECDFNHAEEYTFSRDSHIVSNERKWRRNISRTQFYSKYNNSLGSRYYKSRYRRYNPVDYTSSTHPVSCSSDGSLKERNGFVRRRRRRVRYHKTRPNRDNQPKKNIKKPLASPHVLKNLNICEVPESRHFGDGEKCRQNVAKPKNNNKLRDVNNNNIPVSTEVVHKALKPKVTEEELWRRFQKLFRSYSSTKLHSGDLISSKISNCWMKNVGVVKDVLNYKEAETAFKKAAGQKITMNVHEYKEFLLSLTMRRKLPLFEVYRRMCGI